jgi:hypothetical protein
MLTMMRSLGKSAWLAVVCENCIVRWGLSVRWQALDLQARRVISVIVVSLHSFRKASCERRKLSSMLRICRLRSILSWLPSRSTSSRQSPRCRLRQRLGLLNGKARRA